MPLEMPGAHQTLISADELHAHLGQPDWAILDCRFDLASPDSVAQSVYPAGHIPGAHFADLERDLSGLPTGSNGRHPLPEPGQLVARFSAWGIGPACQVVVYDDNSGYAARAWWCLRYMGHMAVAVLDGGLPAWVERGHPLRSGIEPQAPRTFEGRPNPELVLQLQDVPSSARLLDARAPERFRGEVEPIDRVPGHIPGARSYPWATSLGSDGNHLPAAQLRRQLLTALDGVHSSAAVAYCGSGVTACNLILAMEHVGLTGMRLYPGSWSEWCSDPRRAVEIGDPQATKAD